MIQSKKIYNLPIYYDIGWSYNISHDIKILINIFNNHVPYKVKNILEAACGAGRFLTSFPKYRYKITGYDINPFMFEYTKNKIIKSDLKDSANIILADMRTAAFDTKFDAAFNSINSLGYLITDEDILSHFIKTAQSLKKNAVYIIHISCAYDKEDFSKEYGDWIEERDGIKVKVIWGVKNQDRKNKLNYEYSRLEINDEGKEIILEDNHTMRLWIYEDLKRLIKESKRFTLEAIYDENNKSISLDSHINGEMGNLYFVLKVK